MAERDCDSIAFGRPIKTSQSSGHCRRLSPQVGDTTSPTATGPDTPTRTYYGDTSDPNMMLINIQILQDKFGRPAPGNTRKILPVEIWTLPFVRSLRPQYLRRHQTHPQTRIELPFRINTAARRDHTWGTTIVLRIECLYWPIFYEEPRSPASSRPSGFTVSFARENDIPE